MQIKMKLGRSVSLDTLLLLSPVSNCPLTSHGVDRLKLADSGLEAFSPTAHHHCQHHHYGPFPTYCGRSMIDQATQTPNNWSQMSWIDDYCATTTTTSATATTKAVNIEWNDSSPIDNGIQCRINGDIDAAGTATPLPDLRQLVLEKESISLISPFTTQPISQIPKKQQQSQQFNNQLQQTDSMSIGTCWNPPKCHAANQPNLKSLKRLTSHAVCGGGVGGGVAISNSSDSGRYSNSHNSHDNSSYDDDNSNNNNYYKPSAVRIATSNIQTNTDASCGAVSGDRRGDKTNDDEDNCGESTMAKLTTRTNMINGERNKVPSKSSDNLSKLDIIGTDVLVPARLLLTDQIDQINITKQAPIVDKQSFNNNPTRNIEYCFWKRCWNANAVQQFPDNQRERCRNSSDCDRDDDCDVPDYLDINIFGCDYNDDTENNQNSNNKNNSNEGFMFRIGSQTNGKTCEDYDDDPDWEENFCHISKPSYYDCSNTDKSNTDYDDDNNQCDRLQAQVDSSRKTMMHYSPLRPLPKSMPISIPKANQSNNKSCLTSSNYLGPHHASLTAGKGVTSNCALSFNSTDEFNQEIADLMQKDKMEQCRSGKPDRIANLARATELEKGRCAPVAELFANLPSAHIKAQNQHRPLMENCGLRRDCHVQDVLGLHYSCSPFSNCDDDDRCVGDNNDNEDGGDELDKQTLHKRVLDSYQDRWLLDEEYSLLDQKDLGHHEHSINQHLSSHTKCVKLDSDSWSVLPSPKMISSNIFNNSKTGTITDKYKYDDTQTTARFESNYLDSPDNGDFAVSNNLLIEFLQQQQQCQSKRESSNIQQHQPHYPRSPLKSEFILKPSYRSAFLPVSPNVSFLGPTNGQQYLQAST